MKKFNKCRLLVLIALFCFLVSDNHAQNTSSTDFNGDGITNIDDFLIFANELWVACTCGLVCPTDLDESGITDINDFLIFINEFEVGHLLAPTEFVINTKSIDPLLNCVINGSGLSATFVTGGTQLFSVSTTGSANPITIDVPASSTNKALKYQFALDGSGKLTALNNLVNGQFYPLSARLYKIVNDKILVFLKNDDALEITENRINITLSLKNGMILTPNLPQNNKLQFGGLQFTTNTHLLVYDKFNSVKYETNNAITNYWNGKINGTVIPGLYKYELKINDCEELKFNGQILVSDEQ